MKHYNLNIELHRASGNRVAYILMPMQIDNGLLQAEATRLGVNIVAMTGMDWDDDLTPWPAPGEPPGDPDFKGLSAPFLKYLTNQVLPSVEKELGLVNPERTLCGISLSGLFAVWVRTQTTAFRNIISISGSFWYKGFSAWIKTITIPPLSAEGNDRNRYGRVYLSLGNKEANSPIVAFRSVATDTESVAETLRNDGLDVTFRMVPGNHYQHFESRLQLALSTIFES